MLFNSFEFLIFFPVVVGIYFVLPKKMRQIWLLIASYYFYMSWNAVYALLIFGVTLISYLGARGLDFWMTQGVKRRRKICFSVCVAVVLGALFLFKYLDFVIGTINRLTMLYGNGSTVSLPFSLVLPVGISFYTFQGLGYLIDVYRREIPAEKNFLKYALFISFFPQLVAGPIERSGNLLHQLEEPAEFDYNSAKNGILLMLWGFFEKIWIADTASVVVTQIYENYWEYTAGAVLFATILFGIQIYCDFGGYSHIAIGAAQVLGIRLMDNFRQPYFATSVQDFWRRWHISFSSWFRDYVYIPLGGNRCGKCRAYANLLVTFLLSGLWHGAGWNYVVWGGLHGIYQIVGRMTGKIREYIREKLHISKEQRFYKLLCVLITFALCDFAWLFFRAQDIERAFAMLHFMKDRQIVGQLLDTVCALPGLAPVQSVRMFLAIAVLFLVDCVHEKGIEIRKWFCARGTLFRWGSYVLIWAGFLIVLLQDYGRPAQEFIYFQF